MPEHAADSRRRGGLARRTVGGYAPGDALPLSTRPAGFIEPLSADTRTRGARRADVGPRDQARRLSRRSKLPVDVRFTSDSDQ
jgi:hypothetical protein